MSSRIPTWSKIIQYNTLIQNSFWKSILRLLLLNYSKNRNPVNLLIGKEKVYICNSKVHKKIIKEKKLKVIEETLSIKDLLEIRIKAIVYFLTNHDSPFSLKNLEFLVVYLQTERVVERCVSKHQPKELVTFELGFLGQVTKTVCQGTKTSSRFIQHGYLAIENHAVCFDRALLWTEHEARFFKEACSEIEIEQRFITRNSVNLDSRAILFLLEYPHSRMGIDLMKKRVSQVISLKGQSFDRIILRPHPRSKKHWYSDYTDLLDTYVDLSLEESIICNQTQNVVSISSAGLVSAYFLGCDCFYFNDSDMCTVNFDYQNYYKQLMG